MKRGTSSLIAIVILLLGVVSFWVITSLSPEAERREAPVYATPVETMAVVLSDVDLTISSQGTVQPVTQSKLMSESRGQVVKIYPEFVNGGFFRKGDFLLEIDDTDYEVALAEAEARVAELELLVALEEERAQQAREDWTALGNTDPAPDLVQRIPQLADAKAKLLAAEAQLLKARRDIAKTRVMAPYDGRVLERMVDLGEYVNVGTALGDIYATNAMEVRLPLPPSDLAYLPADIWQGIARHKDFPEVILSAEIAGQRVSWEGKIVRSEGVQDARTRFVYLVAEVSEPYRAGRIPLVPGVFVEAEIEGEHYESIARIPRRALRPGDAVYVLDGESRLRQIPVQVLRNESEETLLSGGVEEGQEIVISALDYFVEGMLAQKLAPIDSESGRVMESEQK